MRYGIKYFILTVSLTMAPAVFASQFPVLDARTAALGGVGIAHGVRNAAFYNPALAALEIEEYDWYLMFPSSGEFVSDPGDIKDDLPTTPGSDVYHKYSYDTVQVAIPTPFLGGAAYVADYSIHTAKVVSEAGFASLEHRAVDVFETGVSVAQLQNILWFENVMVGATVKLMLLESYGYSELVSDADFSLDRDQLERDSVLNFDFGISKEYGVWKVAFVLKNLLERDYDFGNSDASYKFAPQFRTAVAYESRRAMVELDLDLNKSEGIGFASDTMYIGLGWEWKIFRAFSLRTGFQQNLAGTQNSMVSGGIGLKLWSLLLDYSVSVDQDGSGSYMQASWEF